MPAAPDFRLYHSNSLEVLAGLLAATLREPAPGQPSLAPDTILIPQPSMRRWLQASLAEAHGIAANLEFLAPGEFVRRALDHNLPEGDADDAGDELDAAVLRWRLYAGLTDPATLAHPALASLRGYLDGDDPRRPWSLAGELAGAFWKYQAWRRDWLAAWEAGRDPGDPQAELWRRVARGRRHRARRIGDYLARFAGDDGPVPQGLPRRLFVFATVNVSPDVLRVIASQARAGTLHFYLPTPAGAEWGDLQTLAERLRGDAAAFAVPEHPLLEAWGAAGRDFMAMLGACEVVHPSGVVDAGADPLDRAGAISFPDGLLRRLQHDLFHRRARPSGPPRPAVDPGDPSFQLHACHTRLREVQVLHDRLRGLLEDPRFDPPLQPREIAVLAPDIDPYVPYLDAVFGGHGQDACPGPGRESGGPIPYAIADASPLADDPLADVFLRLLALPVARFGLEETLDLLASAPLADAAGLDAAAFERLHGWLHGAGARWGLDAAHRARRGAPADDAYTWQFALDRLLLGHASGDEADLATAGGHLVAPWADLEGGALDALDALLRLLRVLARHERLLGEAMPPRDWRERLLALLDALLPKPPATASGQRALDRLRALVDGFASDAEAAGFDAPVPAEVVRAHFAAALGEADTRAPLLTGGVSFGRMVPMRLLPFRVVCLLGMNDGDFPRRDPAAGLNRLTAELGTPRRRHGDRSTRDDDRYLFLQLFSAAQDVFYVSWLGADPRDGSVREPSALVSELLAAAGAYHADPAAAARGLVLRHPLQPFSPAAFGAGDARHFSYRGQWHPAAGRLSGARNALPPWMEATALLSPPPGPDSELAIEALRRFLLDPAGQFLRQRLGLRLPERQDVGEDIEPLQAPARGLQRSQLQRAVFDALLAGVGTDALHARLRARAMLPSGPPGRRALAQLLDEVGPYARAFADWRADAEPTSLLLEADIDGLRLHGRIADAWPQGIARLRFGARNGPASIRHGLDWLLATAAGVELPFVEFHDDPDHGIGPHRKPALTRDGAAAALRRLLVLRAEGLRRPLPFAPHSAWALYAAATDEQGVRNAAARWRGSERSWAEGEGEALRLALRGRDPFADADALQAFTDLAFAIYGAVTVGQVAAAPSVAQVLPEAADDAEDAA